MGSIPKLLLLNSILLGWYLSICLVYNVPDDAYASGQQAILERLASHIHERSTSRCFTFVVYGIVVSRKPCVEPYFMYQILHLQLLKEWHHSERLVWLIYSKATEIMKKFILGVKIMKTPHRKTCGTKKGLLLLRVPLRLFLYLIHFISFSN